jgi:endonuclease YncB( thermonuclease family)
VKNAREAADTFDVRLILSAFAFLVLFGAIAADAQVVTEVKAADHLVVQGVGEVRLLGVDALGNATGERERKCAEITHGAVQGLIHAKEVRLVADDRVRPQPGLAMHRYVYLPDGRLLNTVLLESGCARLASGYESLQFSATFERVARDAQMNNRGLYGVIAGIPAPAAPASSESRPANKVVPAPNVPYYTAPLPRPAGSLPLGRSHGIKVPAVTADNFDLIRVGMPYSIVVEILGKGEEVSRTETESFVLTSYEWYASDGAGKIEIRFNKDDRVESKRGYRLK